MNKAERVVCFFDINMSAFSKQFSLPNPLSVRRAFELIGEIDEAERVRIIAKGMVKFYVPSFVFDQEKNLIYMLVNRSDKTIADPVFSIPEKSKRRVAKKAIEEGQDFSAHIVIKLPDDDMDSALLLLEYCPKINIVAVTRLFNTLLKFAKSNSPQDYVQPHPDGSIDSSGNSRMINVTHKFDSQGHVSDELKIDLNKGKVDFLELITEKDHCKPFDERDYIKEKHKSLFLTLDENKNIADKFNWIKRVLNNQKSAYDYARIKFKTCENISRNVKTNLDLNMTVENVYLKKAKLAGFTEELQSSYEKCSQTILEKMIPLL